MSCPFPSPKYRVKCVRAVYVCLRPSEQETLVHHHPAGAHAPDANDRGALHTIDAVALPL